MLKQGSVIAIDGPDGVGKTTQLGLLAEYLHAQGHDIEVTRSSGGTPYGARLREASLSNIPRSALEDVYTSLAMQTGVGLAMREWRKHGKTVLVDRSPAAIIAYQVFGSQLAEKDKGYQAAKDMLTLWKLGHLILMDAPAAVLADRFEHREAADPSQNHNYFEKQDRAYRERVREGYQDVPAFLQRERLPIRVHAIDASGSIEIIHRLIIDSLNNNA